METLKKINCEMKQVLNLQPSVDEFVRPKKAKNLDFSKFLVKLSQFQPNYKYIEDNSRKKVAVFFSGGYDSTSLIIQDLEKGYEVYPILMYFNKSDIAVQTAALKQLLLVYPDQIHEPEILVDFQAGVPEGFETYGISQQPLCAFYASFIRKNILEKVSEIQIGYVAGDLAISFLDNLTAVYHNALIFKGYPHFEPRLTFPIKKQFHIESVDYVTDWESTHNISMPCHSCEYIATADCYQTDDKYVLVLNTCGDCSKCSGKTFYKFELNK